MRYLQLDFIRGIAIVLMVIFHISFDLNYFHFINIDIYNHHSHNWFYFRIIIVTLFLLAVGISLSIVYENGIDYKKFLKRVFKLFLTSILITAVTYFVFPKSWIYFGIIHFITVASIFAIFFIKREYLALIVGLVIILLYKFDLVSMHPFYLYIRDILHLPHKTEDLVSFIPWFGVILVGIFIGKKRLFLFPLPKSSFTQKIAFLGKHSLFIYLTHQIFFFGIISGIYYLTH